MTEITAKQIRQQLPAWISQVFGAGVSCSRIEPLLIEASARRYLRIFLKSASTTSSASSSSTAPWLPCPQTLVVSVEKAHQESMPGMRNMPRMKSSGRKASGGGGQTNQTSHDFIVLSAFLREQGLWVPEVFFACSWQGYYIIVQSDMGAMDFATAVSEDLAGGRHQAALELVWAGLDLALEISAIRTIPAFVRHRSFDYEKLSYEMNAFYKAALATTRTGEIASSLRSTGIQEILHKMCRILSECDEKRVLVHRDFHSRNLLLLDKGLGPSGQLSPLGVDGNVRGSGSTVPQKKLAVLDFQDARMGLIYYDWVSLIYDPYIFLPQEMRQAAIDYIFAKEKEGELQQVMHGGEQRRGDMRDLFYLQALQRLFKALATYLHQSLQLKKQKYIASVFSCVQLLQSILNNSTVNNQISKHHLSNQEQRSLLLFLDQIVSSKSLQEDFREV